MTADAGMVDQRAVGHSVSGRKNSQMTRKRDVCLLGRTHTALSQQQRTPAQEAPLMLNLAGNMHVALENYPSTQHSPGMCFQRWLLRP